MQPLFHQRTNDEQKIDKDEEMDIELQHLVVRILENHGNSTLEWQAQVIQYADLLLQKIEQVLQQENVNFTTLLQPFQVQQFFATCNKKHVQHVLVPLLDMLHEQESLFVYFLPLLCQYMDCDYLIILCTTWFSKNASIMLQDAQVADCMCKLAQQESGEHLIAYMDMVYDCFPHIVAKYVGKFCKRAAQDESCMVLVAHICKRHANYVAPHAKYLVLALQDSNLGNKAMTCLILIAEFDASFVMHLLHDMIHITQSNPIYAQQLPYLLGHVISTSPATTQEKTKLVQMLMDLLKRTGFPSHQLHLLRGIYIAANTRTYLFPPFIDDLQSICALLQDVKCKKLCTSIMELVTKELLIAITVTIQYRHVQALQVKQVTLKVKKSSPLQDVMELLVKKAKLEGYTLSKLYFYKITDSDDVHVAVEDQWGMDHAVKYYTQMNQYIPDAQLQMKLVAYHHAVPDKEPIMTCYMNNNIKFRILEQIESTPRMFYILVFNISL